MAKDLFYDCVKFIKRVIQRSQISLVIYEPDEVRIVQWIK